MRVSHLFPHKQQKRTGYVDKTEPGFHSPALPFLGRGGVVTPTTLTLSGSRTRLVSFYLAASALWFGWSCGSSDGGAEACMACGCLCGRGEIWEWTECTAGCTLLIVSCCVRGCRIFVLRWSRCSYCGIFYPQILQKNRVVFIFIHLPVVLFISLDCFGVSCLVRLHNISFFGCFFYRHCCINLCNKFIVKGCNTILGEFPFSSKNISKNFTLKRSICSLKECWK